MVPDGAPVVGGHEDSGETSLRDMKSTGDSQSFTTASSISETSADESSSRSSASVADRTAGGIWCCPPVCTEVRVGEDTDAGGWHEVRRRTRVPVSERTREPTGLANAERTDGRVAGESDRGDIHLSLSTPRGGSPSRGAPVPLRIGARSPKPTYDQKSRHVFRCSSDKPRA